LWDDVKSNVMVGLKVLEYVECKISKFHKKGREIEIFLKFEDKDVTDPEEIQYLKTNSEAFAQDMGITIVEFGHVNEYFSIIFDAVSHLCPTKHLTSVKERNIRLKKEIIENIKKKYEDFYNKIEKK
jgi:hypothetical protein